MGKSGGGGGDGGDSVVRFAPYLEAAHSAILNHTGADDPDLSFIDAFNATINQSPYGAYEQIDIDEGYFGMTRSDPTITYEIKNFPSLWDIFGKFMAGLDVHDLWGQIYSDVIQGPEIENVITAQSDSLQANIDSVVLPKFLGGMRDINSVQATTFIIGKAIIQDAHVRELNKFGAQIRMHALDTSAQLWQKHLDWNQGVTNIYSEMFKLYYASRLDVDRVNLEYPAKGAMWNINLFDNARGILGAMTGSAATTDGATNEPSQTQKAIGGAMAGAAAGAQIGGGYGAIIGGVLGLAASFF